MVIHWESLLGKNRANFVFQILRPLNRAHTTQLTVKLSTFEFILNNSQNLVILQKIKKNQDSQI